MGSHDERKDASANQRHNFGGPLPNVYTLLQDFEDGPWNFHVSKGARAGKAVYHNK